MSPWAVNPSYWAVPQIWNAGVWKIDTSPWNYFSLSKLLLVQLVVLHRAENGSVKPRLSVSLQLRELRRLSWALALCLRGNRLSPMSHEKDKNKGDEAGREKITHNQNPRCMGKEKTLVVARGRKKVQSKTETLASNPPKNPIQSLQSIQTLLKLVFGIWNVKSPKEMEKKSGENDVRESL